MTARTGLLGVWATILTALLFALAALFAAGAGARQQQIAEALEAGVEDYLATH